MFSWLMNWLRKIVLKHMVTDHILYDIATALRGPDSKHDSLKYIFTQRIRWLVGRSTEIIGDFRVDGKIPLDVIVKAVLEVDETDRHFLDHVEYALDVLDELELIGIREFIFLGKLCYYLKKLTYNEGEEQILGMESIDTVVKHHPDLIS